MQKKSGGSRENFIRFRIQRYFIFARWRFLLRFIFCVLAVKKRLKLIAF